MRAAEEESVVRLPRKRKEDANSCEVTPDLERGEGVVAVENLDIEIVDEEDETDKSKVSFNPLFPLAIVDGSISNRTQGRLQPSPSPSLDRKTQREGNQLVTISLPHRENSQQQQRQHHHHPTTTTSSILHKNRPSTTGNCRLGLPHHFSPLSRAVYGVMVACSAAAVQWSCYSGLHSLSSTGFGLH